MEQRILIISHNAFSTFQNMGKTLDRLFKTFRKDNLFQLYFHSSFPNLDKCASIYRITDSDITNKILRKSTVVGRTIESKEISINNNLFDDKLSEKYHLAKKKWKYLYVIRDILWKTNIWDNNKLHEWIEKTKPKTIFFAAGDAIFPYVITLKLSEMYNLPIITYYTDDYFFYNKNTSFLGGIFHKELKKNIKKICERSSHTIFISESMQEAYTNEGILLNKSSVVMTPYENQIKPKEMRNGILKLVFAGNISLNRWKTLKSIGDTLIDINKNGVKATLYVYSGSQEYTAIEHLKNNEGVKFMGNVSSEELERIYIDSDILVHVESFEKGDTERVKHSISSKIPDYLASNRLIIACGPKDVASIEYLQRHNAAICVTNESDLYKKLQYLFDNFDQTDGLIIEALRIASENHNINSINTKMKQIVCGVER